MIPPLVFLCLTAFAQLNPPTPTPAKTTQEHQSYSNTKAKKTDIENQPAPPWLSASPIGVAKNVPRDTQQSQQKSSTDWWITAFTGVLAVVAVLQFFSIWKQSRFMQRGERAWMVGEPNMPKLATPTEPSVALLYVCNVKNAGRTPARIKESGLAFRKAESTSAIPQIPNYGRGETRSFNGLPVTPGDSFAATTVSIITREEFLAVQPNAQGLILYAYGFVKYLDIFDRSHETCFCHYYHIPSQFEAQLEGFRICIDAPPAYNRAT